MSSGGIVGGEWHADTVGRTNVLMCCGEGGSTVMWCEWCKWRVVIYGTHTTVGVSNIHIHPCTSLSVVACVSSGGMIEQRWHEGAVSRGSMCVHWWHA